MQFVIQMVLCEYNPVASHKTCISMIDTSLAPDFVSSHWAGMTFRTSHPSKNTGSGLEFCLRRTIAAKAGLYANVADGSRDEKRISANTGFHNVRNQQVSWHPLSR